MDGFAEIPKSFRETSMRRSIVHAGRRAEVTSRIPDITLYKNVSFFRNYRGILIPRFTSSIRLSPRPSDLVYLDQSVWSGKFFSQRCFPSGVYYDNDINNNNNNYYYYYHCIARHPNNCSGVLYNGRYIK